jgi:hypothetical protein
MGSPSPEEIAAHARKEIEEAARAAAAAERARAERNNQK